MAHGASVFDSAAGAGENRNPMRVLFATSRFPGTGPRGDQQRAYQQLRQLARRHAITLLTPDMPDLAHPAYRDLENLCERIAIVPRTPSLVAEIVAVPGATAVTTPSPSTVATAGASVA
jgi:hypothetical protein